MMSYRKKSLFYLALCTMMAVSFFPTARSAQTAGTAPTQDEILDPQLRTVYANLLADVINSNQFPAYRLRLEQLQQFYQPLQFTKELKEAMKGVTKRAGIAGAQRGIVNLGRLLAKITSTNIKQSQAYTFLKKVKIIYTSFSKLKQSPAVEPANIAFENFLLQLIRPGSPMILFASTMNKTGKSMTKLIEMFKGFRLQAALNEAKAMPTKTVKEIGLKADKYLAAIRIAQKAAAASPLSATGTTGATGSTGTTGATGTTRTSGSTGTGAATGTTTP